MSLKKQQITIKYLNNELFKARKKMSYQAMKDFNFVLFWDHN